MKEYEFELLFQLPDRQGDPEAYIDPLYEAGLDDAMFGTGKPGVIVAMVTREVESAAQAIESAIAQTMKAIPGAQLVEVSPDQVNPTDVAFLLGVSRQAASKLLSRDDAPMPCHMGHHGSASTWNLVTILSWLDETGRAENYGITPEMIEVAATAKRINIARSIEVTPRIASKVVETILRDLPEVQAATREYMAREDSRRPALA